MNMLICVAGMPHATPTVRFGGKIAALDRSSVTLLTVGQAGSMAHDELDAMLNQASQLLNGLPVQFKIRQGSPAQEIIRQSKEEVYDLIVMGERNGGRTDLFLSSVVRKVVSKACAPVLIVKRERSDLKRILICTGGRQVAELALATGARLAKAAAAQATLLHVANPLPSMYAGVETMEEKLEELLQTDTPVARHLRQGAAILDNYGLEAQLELRHGVAAHEILYEARQGDYDLIVIGHWSGTRWWRGLLAKDVTRQVVDNATRPVLTVCKSKQAAAHRGL